MRRQAVAGQFPGRETQLSGNCSPTCPMPCASPLPGRSPSGSPLWQCSLCSTRRRVNLPGSTHRNQRFIHDRAEFMHGACCHVSMHCLRGQRCPLMVEDGVPLHCRNGPDQRANQPIYLRDSGGNAHCFGDVDRNDDVKYQSDSTESHAPASKKSHKLMQWLWLRLVRAIPAWRS